jgi:putative CocE/NonD family hydrolase
VQYVESPAGVLGIIFEKNVPATMRDGVVLRADIARPDAPGRFPALLMRTPYGKGLGNATRFVRAGYAFVCQDSRGRYASDGQYRVFTIDDTGDARDGYDTVEWLAAQPWCDGSVGTMGASYCAWMQYKLAALRPPHLKAMSAVSIPPEASCVDWPGAFKPARRINWWLTTIAPDLRKRAGLGPPHTPAEAKAIWDGVERQQLLGLLPWSRVVEFLPEPLAGDVADWLTDPGRRVWRFDEAHAQIEVPNLDFTGWWDHCSSIAHLEGMQRNAATSLAREQSKTVIGPWDHCNLGKRRCGEIDFGPKAEVDTVAMQIRWFDRWLKGIENGVDREPAVRYFTAGSAKWCSADAWPPKRSGEKSLFLADGGALTPEPHASEGADGYRYDPHNPCPSLMTPTQFYVASDRRRLDHRGDILRYSSGPLREDVEIVGHPEAVLFAATSAPDTDWFVHLVDDDPDGIALEVSYGFVRARHRNGTDREELLAPGETVEYRVRLRPTAYRFRAGHCVRLEISSSCFPDHDRNHNTGRDDLHDPELVAADQRVLRGAAHPSRIVLPLT